MSGSTTTLRVIHIIEPCSNYSRHHKCITPNHQHRYTSATTHSEYSTNHNPNHPILLQASNPPHHQHNLLSIFNQPNPHHTQSVQT